VLLASQSAWAQDGTKLYRELCASCHGEDGDGDGPAARFLTPLPRDFTSGQFKFRTTPLGSPPTDADIIRTIARGVPGTAMPAWSGRIDAAEMAAVAQVVRGFGSTAAPPPAGLQIPDAPALDEAAVARGQVFFQAMCATCHGETGAGNGPGSEGLTDGWGEPIRPANFTRGVYKSGSAPEDLYRTISTGLQGTPMVSFGALSDAQRWDLVATVRSFETARRWERGRVPQPPRSEP